MRVEYVKEMLAEIPDHYDVDIVEFDKKGFGDVVCVTEDYYKREKIEDELEDVVSDVDRLRNRVGDLIEDFDALGDRFDENSLVFKRMVEFSTRLDAIEDLLHELGDRLEGMKK